MMKNVTTEGVYKDEAEFNWRLKSLGQNNKTCRDCQHGFKKTYYGGDARQRHLQKVKESTNAAREAARKPPNSVQKFKEDGGSS